MLWWQALLLAVVPAAVVGASLGLQQRWARALEVRRLEQLVKEQDHLRGMANDQRDADAAADRVEHERDLVSTWREERRGAHEELIGSLLPLVATVSVQVYDAIRGYSLTSGAAGGGLGRFDRDRLESLEKPVHLALPRVLLLASEEAKASAADVAQQAETLVISLIYGGDPAYFSEDVRGVPRGRLLLRDLHQAQDDYVSAARRDVGTDD
ncbi:hypothetical protein GTR02_15780 [Kineococcus sp. R8]|uniref:hypothetical protein n=1 Tax=Kineococcus siccus TaxID=2696567 RepID=UPI0014131CF7|nr:hypothetical protein [Kineococcus siccus]NAZ83280.1 hypothetical protein [Kineococcus siccus]